MPRKNCLRLLFGSRVTILTFCDFFFLKIFSFFDVDHFISLFFFKFYFIFKPETLY